MHVAAPGVKVKLMVTTHKVKSKTEFELRYDRHEVDGDLVVECWISQGPRPNDATFDPSSSDWVTAVDDEVASRRAPVTKREGNRV